MSSFCKRTRSWHLYLLEKNKYSLGDISHDKCRCAYAIRSVYTTNTKYTTTTYGCDMFSWWATSIGTHVENCVAVRNQLERILSLLHPLQLLFFSFVRVHCSGRRSWRAHRHLVDVDQSETFPQKKIYLKTKTLLPKYHEDFFVRKLSTVI